VPRAIWSGSVSFGLVNIPVKLYSAVSRKTVHFNQLDARTGARIKQKRVDSETGEEVPWDQIVKGYELASGAYVTVTDDEMASLDPKAVRTIEIEEFVDLSAIDPIFYDSAYYLAPDKSSKPYALLARAMEEQGKVGIAHFVLRTKQYLAAIRPSDGRLLLSTMVYADEVNDPSAIDELDDVVDVKISAKELAMATQLVESLAGDFEPERFRDTYRDAVLELIEKKAAGEEVVAPVSQIQPEKVVDLMAALEASVAAAKEARTRHPTAHDADAEATEDEPAGKTRTATAKKAPAKKSAAKKATAKKAAAKKSAARKSA
jgi:DNA end-binding protein Ku